MVYDVSGVGPTLTGRNGEGNWDETDGEIRFAVLSVGGGPIKSPTEFLADTPLVAAKNIGWKYATDLFAPPATK